MLSCALVLWGLQWWAGIVVTPTGFSAKQEAHLLVLVLVLVLALELVFVLTTMLHLVGLVLVE